MCVFSFCVCVYFRRRKNLSVTSQQFLNRGNRLNWNKHARGTFEETDYFGEKSCIFSLSYGEVADHELKMRCFFFVSPEPNNKSLGWLSGFLQTPFASHRPHAFYKSAARPLTVLMLLSARQPPRAISSRTMEPIYSHRGANFPPVAGVPAVVMATVTVSCVCVCVEPIANKKNREAPSAA